jgi:hypothetical protein
VKVVKRFSENLTARACQGLRLAACHRKRKMPPSIGATGLHENRV